MSAFDPAVANPAPELPTRKSLRENTAASSPLEIAAANLEIPSTGNRPDPPKGAVQTTNKPKPKRKGTSFLGLLREVAIIIAAAFLLSWLIKTFLMQAFFIPSESMENTLDVGDRVMVSRLTPRFSDVQRGDVVVFHDPGDWLGNFTPPQRHPVAQGFITVFTAVGLLPHDSGDHLIKRVIGIAGDQVACCNADGLVTVNGVPIYERSYLRAGAIPSRNEFETTVPEGMLFVMGDNRDNSADSRYNTERPYGGFVPVENVAGVAFAVVWPLNHLQILRNPREVFELVP